MVCCGEDPATASHYNTKKMNKSDVLLLWKYYKSIVISGGDMQPVKVISGNRHKF